MVQARCDGCGLVEASRRMEDVEPGFGQVFQGLSARHSLPDQLPNLGGGVGERLRLAEAEDGVTGCKAVSASRRRAMASSSA